MRSSKELRILFVGEGLEKFAPQIEVLKDQFHFIIEDEKKCLNSCLSIKNLSLIVFQKRSVKDYCANCIKRIKGFIPQTMIVVLCEEIAKKTVYTLFRHGVRDILENSFDKEINLRKATTKLKFIFSSIPKNREKRYNYLDLKHIKDFKPLNELVSDDKRIEMAKTYIDNHYNCALALEETAKVACMSKYHFCRTFITEEGISFKEYLTNVRIEKAKELLKNRNASIAEVAYGVGFSSLSHFTTLFKSHLNISPGGFRKIALKALFYTFFYQCLEQAAFLLV